MKEADSTVLESQEHRDLLDIVDKLRSGGVSRYIDLPQIVVCGDQSSGKSSVLEAISGMAFPAKDNLCTRFATEVILRRAPTSAVSFSIAPAADRSQAEKEKLRAFSSTGSLDTLDLGQVVDDARSLMGVGEQKAFSSDVLRVELSGPSQPHLTMVDLPGLFRAGNLEQSAEDADLVKNLVLSYMKRQRTIILAVVSAKSDFALQEVTQLARELDPKGHRTLGLITKPDTLDEGSDSEMAYLKLAQNNDVHFRLGWHVLRNRDFGTRTATLEERNRAEMQFFSHGVWTSMSPSHLGVTTLRKRLTSVLHDQVLSQLPQVVTDLEEKVQECRDQLQKIGPSRATTQEQRQYLIQASHQFYKLMRASADGNYTDPYFGAPEQGDEKRLRALVQNSLLELASVMRSEGRAQEIVETGTSPTGPREVSRDDFLAEVKEMI
ncbi:dynamin family protein, partial [Candidatus Bathyarchaeota archaeon]|nr:dynamin family protein [Candidatus Bathyarchaeota archaeon]